MRILYHLGLYLYLVLIRLAALYSPKARQWLRGRRGWKADMERAAAGWVVAGVADTEQAVAEQAAAEQAAAGEAAAGMADAEQAAAGKNAMEGSAAGKCVAGKSAAGMADAEQAAAGKCVAGKADTEQAVAGGAVAGKNAMEGSAAEKCVAGKSAAGSAGLVRGKQGERGVPTLWFHCASLGEFEQGRPVLERFRQEYPGWRIVLTFFSPSGYEHRKDYQHADHVFYLPADTPSRVQAFLDIWKPSVSVFVKYEYWFNYLDALHRRNIPHILVSAIFRPGQHFFRPWGAWFRRHLSRFSHLFAQDEASAQLLSRFGIQRHTISGDTRFDRVYALGFQKESLVPVEAFAGDAQVLVAGSTWPKDEVLLAHLLVEQAGSLKLIIAPHEVDAAHVSKLKATFREAVCLSDFDAGRDHGRRVLIIDRIGILSKLYRYGHIAYIGGGFGQGIHNILEAATYGMPILFGPRHQKFAEARDLLKRGGAFCVSDGEDLVLRVEGLLSDEALRQRSAVIARQYVEEKRGATECVMKWLRTLSVG